MEDKKETPFIISGEGKSLKSRQYVINLKGKY